MTEFKINSHWVFYIGILASIVGLAWLTTYAEETYLKASDFNRFIETSASGNVDFHTCTGSGDSRICTPDPSRYHEECTCDEYWAEDLIKVKADCLRNVSKYSGTYEDQCVGQGGLVITGAVNYLDSMAFQLCCAFNETHDMWCVDVCNNVGEVELQKADALCKTKKCEMVRYKSNTMPGGLYSGEPISSTQDWIVK